MLEYFTQCEHHVASVKSLNKPILNTYSPTVWNKMIFNNLKAA